MELVYNCLITGCWQKIKTLPGPFSTGVPAKYLTFKGVGGAL
ncbi:hypothetical protein Niako_1279 [Niastella koreensis GR20-10]|uniref:Uncharacterized protein n=1 Tax=Niastella koreensis (strain DSM 17620 / KACC 11465 / NBRC 106392 / GR20-10) TaxID=700598 RepID=G8TLQ8_NIAKG|nr:hypothetical protein Niako_1279 [Niastella koreensis GR20-10]